MTVCFGTQFPGEYLMEKKPVQGKWRRFLIRNLVRIEGFSVLPCSINLILLRGLIFFSPEINQTQTAFPNNFFFGTK